MFRRSSFQPIAVVAVIAANLLALGNVLAADPNRLAWAPTRDDAIVIGAIATDRSPHKKKARRTRVFRALSIGR